MELRTLRVLARLARIPSRLTIAVSARSARTHEGFRPPVFKTVSSRSWCSAGVRLSLA
jgi:hypothetical protein